MHLKGESWYAGAIRDLFALAAGFVIVLSASTFVVFQLEKLFYYAMPASYWIETVAPIRPANPAFKKGDKIEFISRYDIHRDVSVEWYDSLYCSSEHDGWDKKTRTQFEHGPLKARSPKDVKWEYYAEKVPPGMDICSMCGEKIIKLPYNTNKKDYYCTIPFKVNQ